MTALDPLTFVAATEVVLNRQLAEHEAGHASAALLVGLDVAEVVSPFHRIADLADTPFDHDNPAGHALIERREDPDGLRKMAIATLAPRINDPYWPPRFPLRQVPEPGDEADLSALVKQLDLDADGYAALTRETARLVASREYQRLTLAIGHMLELHGRLDRKTLRRIKSITEGAKVEHKTLTADTIEAVDTGTDLGQFTALVSAWDADREGDTIERSAFDKTIAAWQQSGKRLPLLFEHTTEEIGHVHPNTMHTTDAGLIVSGEVDRSTDHGAQAWRQIKRGTAGFSIGFMSKSRPRPDGRKGRSIHEVDLFEISHTSTPINAATRALAWKSATALDTERVRRETRDLMFTLMAGDTGDTPRAKSQRYEREYGPVQVAEFGC